MNTLAVWAGAACALMSFVLPSQVLAQLGPADCGPIVQPGQWGPYDYRSNKDKWATVETYHFTPSVEALTKSISGKLGSDIGYTLQRFPNHHRALVSLMRLTEREKVPKVLGEEYSTECRFERALRYQPDDSVARMLFAEFLRRQGRAPEAKRQLEVVSRQKDLSAFTYVSLGSIYLELGEHDLAMDFARKARKEGLTASPLFDRLKSMGRDVTAE